MNLARVCRYTVGCAAAVAFLAAATPGQVAPLPIPPNPVAPGEKPKLKWADVCSLSVSDGRLVLRCDVTLDMLRVIDGSDMELDGLPGTTSLTIMSKRYEVRNEQRLGNEDQLVLSIYSIRSGLTISSERTLNGKTLRTSFDQPGNDFRRGGRGDGDVRLTVWGGGNGDGIVVEASDFAALRKQYPHQTNRYLRPLLRQLKADVFQIDVRAARQVLFSLADESTPARVTDLLPFLKKGPATTLPSSELSYAYSSIFPTDHPSTAPSTAPSTRPADPPLSPEVQKLVDSSLADLDSPDFRKRQSAVDQLAQLGPQAVAALLRIDRAKLSAQQGIVIDMLEATSTPLPADEALRRRADPHFLIDCLYLPEPGLRQAAVEQLVRLGKGTAKSFERVLAIDPKKSFDEILPVIEKLRDELVPAK